MTLSEAETIAATDKATVAILNALITFLEMQGAMKRHNFADSLQATMKAGV